VSQERDQSQKVTLGLLGQAEALNHLGELATRTAGTPQARQHHTQALAIARGISASPEAHAQEGLGHSHLQDGNPGQAAAHLLQALAIYQRIGAPAARRVQETLHQHGLTPTTEPAAPSSEGNQPRAPSHPNKPSRDKSPAGSAAEQPDLREHRRQAPSNANVHNGYLRAGADQRLLRAVTRFQVRRRADRRLRAAQIRLTGRDWPIADPDMPVLLLAVRPGPTWLRCMAQNQNCQRHLLRAGIFRSSP